MTSGAPGSQRDRWAQWIVERRFGGDADAKAATLANFLVPLRERVLDAAEPLRGQRVLDVGCGDGLIGFGALERGAGEVIFSDISRDLLAECERLAEERGVSDRCVFVEASADDLRPIDSGAADAITVRSVLIYVHDKRSCFLEFARVLRDGGRLSIFEPVNRFGQRDWTGSRFFGADLEPVAEAAEKVRAYYRSFLPDDDPMLDFDERDLMRLAEDAGFDPIELVLTAEVGRGDPTPWHVFLNTAASPKLPTPTEAFANSLSEGERSELIAHLRPLIESGRTTRRAAHAYLRGVRATRGRHAADIANPS